MLSEELQSFLWNTKQPWFKLAYKLYWSQLNDIISLNNLKILDFGSGFGVLANIMAKDNKVTAIEPNADMLEERDREYNYTQISGKIEKLKDFSDGYFDVIACHNVLEFAPEERAEIVKEFSRILKTGGILSVIKHNKPGKIIHDIAFDNNIEEAMTMLDGGERKHNAFGKIDYYEPEDLIKWGNNLKIEKILGVRIFYALNTNNEIRYKPYWIAQMFGLEMKVCDLEPYKSIAFLHHVLLRKI